MTEPQRFFFVHLQKTAGTALWRRLHTHFDESALYPGPGDGEPPTSTLMVPHLLERWQLRRDEIRVVAGHFPLCTVELLGISPVTLTVLREPVERSLSFLRHHRETAPEIPDSQRDTTSLEEIYDDPFAHALLHNHMVKMFSLTTAEMTAGAMSNVEFGPDRLETAKRNLSSVHVVGLQEHFEAFCSELTRRFGWNLGPPVFMNRTQPFDASDALRNRIARENALDAELYEYARGLAIRAAQ